MSPRAQAAQDFLIWREARRAGWAIDVAALAEAFRLDPGTVGRRLIARDWHKRLRVSPYLRYNPKLMPASLITFHPHQL